MRGMSVGKSVVDTLAVLHVADLFREPRMVLASRLDWKKVGRYLRGEWPRPIPPRVIVDHWQPFEIDAWFEQAMSASFVALDTEYNEDTRYLTLLGLGYPEMAEGIQLVWPKMPPPMRDKAKGWLALLIENKPVVMHNAMADVPVLDQNLGIPYEAYKHIDDTMLAHAVLWSDYPHDLEYLASIYSMYPKMKHLAKANPTLYNWGDVLATIEVWVSLQKELDRDPQTKHTYLTRMLPLVPILLQASQSGIRVDGARARQALARLRDTLLQANDRAAAWTGYPINLASSQQVISALFRDGIKAKSVESEKVYSLLLKYPENELLRARYTWSQAEGFRKYIASIAELDRVHPLFLPTQATGRISVKEPPIVNFPHEGKAQKRGLPDLRACFVPDEGHWWLCWDWEAMHARFMSAVSNDREDLEAYKNGLDVHLLTARRIFGKQDIDSRERHLAKTVRYALLNGLDHKAVREAKEVVEQGLDMDELEKVAKAFLAAKPAMTIWKREYAQEAIRKGEARSLYGRKRRLLGSGDRMTDEKMKAAISGFLQMTEVDIMTETLTEACRRWPEARLVYPSHDGIKLQFPNDIDPVLVYENLKPWVEREHDFYGRRLALPAEWEVVYSDGRKDSLCVSPSLMER